MSAAKSPAYCNDDACSWCRTPCFRVLPNPRDKDRCEYRESQGLLSTRYRDVWCFDSLVQAFIFQASNMITVSEMRRHSGAGMATFAVQIGDVVRPGCALVRRGDGAALSLQRVGQPGAQGR